MSWRPRALHLLTLSFPTRRSADLGDQLLDIGAKLLGFRDRGRDLFVLDERCRHVAEQGDTMGRGTLKLPAADAMTHGISFQFVRGPCEVPRARWDDGPP